jgi:hypothetical protein
LEVWKFGEIGSLEFGRNSNSDVRDDPCTPLVRFLHPSYTPLTPLVQRRGIVDLLKDLMMDLPIKFADGFVDGFTDECVVDGFSD